MKDSQMFFMIGNMWGMVAYLLTPKEGWWIPLIIGMVAIVISFIFMRKKQ